MAYYHLDKLNNILSKIKVRGNPLSADLTSRDIVKIYKGRNVLMELSYTIGHDRDRTDYFKSIMSKWIDDSSLMDEIIDLVDGCFFADPKS